MLKNINNCFIKSVGKASLRNVFFFVSKVNEKQSKIEEKLRNGLNPIKLEVKDISGGCGDMFNIVVESSKFEGMTKIQQHRLVQALISEELKSMHGLNLKTFCCKN